MEKTTKLIFKGQTKTPNQSSTIFKKQLDFIYKTVERQTLVVSAVLIVLLETTELKDNEC